MKIVHVTESWVGGISTYVQSLAKRQAMAGHTVTILYSPSMARHGFDKALFEAIGIQCVPYESSRNPLKVLSCAKAVRDIVREISPDIVHLHSSFPGLYGRVLKPEFRVVYCAHGWSFVEENGAVKRFLYRVIERFLARRSDAIINVSEREYQSAINAGIAAEKMHVVLNGAEDVREPLEEIDFEPETGITNLLYIGRLDPKKGFDLLYDYFKTHRPQNVHLTVIGEAARSRAQYFNDESIGVTFLGWVDADLIDSYIRKFDAMIVPSRYEAFGLVVLEAMRNGVPAIVSRDTAMPEMVQDGYNGYVFDVRNFRNEMDRILNIIDRVQLAEMGRNARHVYEEKFTAPRMVDEVMAVYKHLLKK